MAKSKRPTPDFLNEVAGNIGNIPESENTPKNEGTEEIEGEKEEKNETPPKKPEKKERKKTKRKGGPGRPRRDIKTVKKYFDLRQDLNEYLIRKSEEEERSVTTLINRAIKEMMERDNDI